MQLASLMNIYIRSYDNPVYEGYGTDMISSDDDDDIGQSNPNYNSHQKPLVLKPPSNPQNTNTLSRTDSKTDTKTEGNSRLLDKEDSQERETAINQAGIIQQKQQSQPDSLLTETKYEDLSEEEKQDINTRKAVIERRSPMNYFLLLSYVWYVCKYVSLLSICMSLCVIEHIEVTLITTRTPYNPNNSDNRT